MDDTDWSVSGIDISRPSAARMYDYHLGGSHNFAVDRRMAEQIVQIMPDLPLILRANRAFLRRAVRYLVDAGIRQFLDLGSGIPTVGNVHEIAQQAAPGSRVVYADIDPVAVAHAEQLLEGNADAAAVRADLRDPDATLGTEAVSRLLDLSQPVGLLMVAVLHFVPDSDDPAAIVRRYRDRLVPGSHLVLSHAAASDVDGAPEGADEATEAFSRNVTETTLRTRAEVTAMADGWDLVDPGVCYVVQWRPDPGEPPVPDPQRIAQWAAVARKP